MNVFYESRQIRKAVTVKYLQRRNERRAMEIVRQFCALIKRRDNLVNGIGFLANDRH